MVGGVDTADLPPGVAIESEAVSAQANSADVLPALLPVGLGARGGELHQIFRNAFDRVALNGEQIPKRVRPMKLPICRRCLTKLVRPAGRPTHLPTAHARSTRPLALVASGEM